MKTQSSWFESQQGGSRFVVPEEAPLPSAFNGGALPSGSLITRSMGIQKRGFGVCSFLAGDVFGTSPISSPYDGLARYFKLYAKQTNTQLHSGTYQGIHTVDPYGGSYPLIAGNEPNSIADPTLTTRWARLMPPVFDAGGGVPETYQDAFIQIGPYFTMVLENAVDTNALYDFIKGKLLAHAWPAPFISSNFFGQNYTFNDFGADGPVAPGFPRNGGPGAYRDVDNQGLNPAQWDGSEFNVNFNDPSVNLPGSFGNGSGNGWNLGLDPEGGSDDGLYALFTNRIVVSRFQSRLFPLNQPSQYYWIGRAQFANRDSDFSLSDQLEVRIIFISDGEIQPGQTIGDQGDIEVPFPDNGPFVTGGMSHLISPGHLDQALISDYYFISVGEDPVGFTRRTGLIIGDNLFA